MDTNLIKIAFCYFTNESEKDLYFRLKEMVEYISKHIMHIDVDYLDIWCYNFTHKQGNKGIYPLQVPIHCPYFTMYVYKFQLHYVQIFTHYFRKEDAG